MIVVAEAEGRLCGYFHALRFRMRLGGQPAMGALLTDLGTLNAYRRQGVFRAMCDFLLDRLRADGVHLIYTLPNARGRSLPGFVRKHRFTVVASLPVYVAPLDLGALVASRLRLGPPGRWLGWLLEPLVRALTVRTSALDSADEVVRLDRLDERLDPLVRDFARDRSVGLERNLRYLRWRFLDKPTKDYTVWALVRGGRLSAYVVTRQAALSTPAALCSWTSAVSRARTWRSAGSFAPGSRPMSAKGRSWAWRWVFIRSSASWASSGSCASPTA